MENEKYVLFMWIALGQKKKKKRKKSYSWKVGQKKDRNFLTYV